MLVVASLRLSPLNLFNFGLFNCGWTSSSQLFVLAVAGLRLGVLESFPGQLMFGTSPGALRLSILTDCFHLVNVSRSVLSPAI